MWIDEYLEHEKLRGLILDGDSDIIVVSCPECGAAQACPVDDFDIDEFEFFHLVDHYPNDPDHDPDRRHEWASVLGWRRSLGLYS